MEQVEKPAGRRLRIPALWYLPGTSDGAEGFVPAGAISMLMTKERRPAIRTLRGWAILVLQDAGAIREREKHGWMQDRADPHARERAFEMARLDPPSGLSPEQAVAEIRDVLDSIGDTCPDCPPDDL
jgi:acetyl-CoA acetyltransferase